MAVECSHKFCLVAKLELLFLHAVPDPRRQWRVTACDTSELVSKATKMNRATRQSNGYRLDIDGLRGVSVLAVILFHLNSQWLPGGFVGVDVFFVISGYLISKHIFDEIGSGTFSLTEFYRRRIKRIAPAMLAVVAVSLVIALLVMRPADAVKMAKSAVWSLASIANVYFWAAEDTGYFAASSAEQPLLHLWSLGVEEQFYIVWPLLAMLFYRAGREKAMLVAMLFAAVASFAFGSIYFSHDPSFVYYMLPSRAGELLLGAVVALLEKRGAYQRLPASFMAPIALAGMVLLATSLILLSEAQPFPGWMAAPPTVGVACLLFTGCGRGTWISRGLSARPLVWVGAISYSAYLWHWPLLAFYRYGYGPVSVPAAIVIFALTIGLAWATFAFVEQPARRARLQFRAILTRQFIVPATALAAIALTAIYADRLWPDRTHSAYRQQLASLREQAKPASSFAYVCQRQHLTHDDATDARCVLGATASDASRVLLWGDSNAAHYVGMLGSFALKESFAFRNIQVGSCPPLLADPTAFAEARRAADCRHATTVIRPLLDDADVVIISASWSSYEAVSDRFLETFFSTARQIAASGRMVVLIGKLPLMPTFDRLCAEKALSFPFVTCKDVRIPVSDDVARANARLRRFAESTPNVRYFEATPYVCPGGSCSAYGKDGRALYYDQSHLTMAGSWKLGQAITDAHGVPAAFRGIAEWRVNGGGRARFSASD